MDRKGGYSYQIEKIVTMEDLEIDYQRLQNVITQAIIDANEKMEESRKKEREKNILLNIFAGIQKAILWLEFAISGIGILRYAIAIFTNYQKGIRFTIDNLAYVMSFGVIMLICGYSALKTKADDDLLLEFLNANIAIIALIIAFISLTKGGCGC